MFSLIKLFRFFINLFLFPNDLIQLRIIIIFLARVYTALSLQPGGLGFPLQSELFFVDSIFFRDASIGRITAISLPFFQKRRS